jgi:glycogen operon protein
MKFAVNGINRRDKSILYLQERGAARVKEYRINLEDKGIYPTGLTRVKGGIHVSVEAAAEVCSLVLYALKEPEADPVRIPFPKEGRTGDVWEMTVLGRDLDRYAYAFEADEAEFPDPYGRSFTGHEQWGDLQQATTPMRTPIRKSAFDWEGDQPLNLPYEDCIVYRAHVRGFTRHQTSGVPGRGTFRGVVEKIPYLKELGITTLELLPVAEFQEVIMPKRADGNPYGEKPEPTGKINYWGYTSAYAFAPKAAYAGRRCDPVIEFKKMVRALHQAGIELVIEMYFDGTEAPSRVLEAVRFWVQEYHVDGVHLVGSAPLHMLAKDPYLAGTKLWADHWSDADVTAGRPKRLGEYNDGFQTGMRRVLKGDEGQMQTLAACTRRNPSGWAVLNYMAGTNGYTLQDMVTYEQKHNEANGENNHDGNDYNYTWNCGAEGPSRKKSVTQMRRRQIRNALFLLFLSQGTPVLLAGDEFGNTQNGNNNAYCQDNEISWLNWRQQKTNHELFAFTKALIAFRRSHPVFRQPKETMRMDYLACGHPDISFHGANAWVPEYEVFRRQLGIFYCGAYGRNDDGTADRDFYVAYNMHGEPYELALPNLPKPLSWHVAAHSGMNAFPEGDEAGEELESQRQLTVEPRTIVVLESREGTLNQVPVNAVKKRTIKKKETQENAKKP